MENRDRDMSGSDRIIAIGGAVLSRGVTLDGLGISYFYQSPRASDTLLQMGRWFGYRDGYADLCHLWIDDEVAQDFRQAYDAIEDLRNDLVRMRQERLTPRDFGLAVEQHPDALLITAQNKMQATLLMERPVWLYAQRLETVKLDISDPVLEENIGHAKQLVERLVSERGEPIETLGSFSKWQDVSYRVVEEFLRGFIGAPNERPALNPQSLADYTARLGPEKFPYWDVVFFGHRKEEVATWGGISMRSSERSVKPSKEPYVIRVSGSSARLAGSSDVRALLPIDVADMVEEEWRKDHGDSERSKVVPEDSFYEKFSKPVLMVYLVRPKPHEKIPELDFLVAPKFIFPGKPYEKVADNAAGRSKERKFVLNSVAARQLADRCFSLDDEEDDLP